MARTMTSLSILALKMNIRVKIVLNYETLLNVKGIQAMHSESIDI